MVRAFGPRRCPLTTWTCASELDKRRESTFPEDPGRTQAGPGNVAGPIEEGAVFTGPTPARGSHRSLGAMEHCRRAQCTEDLEDSRHTRWKVPHEGTFPVVYQWK